MIDLQRTRLIAKREWTTRLKQRSFRITTLVQVLFIVVGAALPAIIAVSSGDNSGGDSRTVLVLDTANVNAADRITPYLEVAGPVAADDTGAGGAAIAVEAVNTSEDDARARVKDGDASGALVVNRGADQRLAFTYFSKDAGSDELTQRVFAGASALSTEDRLQQLGISEDAYSSAAMAPAFALKSPEGTTTMADGPDDFDAAKYAIALVFTVLTFMAIMLYGTWVAQGVVEEKSSRIMEIMINAATPGDLLAGKITGIGLAGLTQMVPMLLAGGLVFGFQRRLTEAFGGSSGDLPDVDFGSLSVRAIGFFLIYFLLGFTLYAAMYAGLASLVSRQEEVNTAISPMMTVMMIGYIGAIFSISAPDSLWARILSIVPFTAPFGMIPRIIVSSVPAWEIAVSLGALAVTMVLLVWLASKLYRMGVLMYGQKPSLKSLFRSGAIRTAR